jgi:hypothetical protein
MKPIFYGVAILAACGAAFFSYSHLKKFETLEAERVQTIQTTMERNASADVADKGILEERKQLATSKEKRELLTQSVSSLSSTGVGLANNLTRLDSELKSQDEEFAQLKVALDEVNLILADLGGGVTLDSLPETIERIQADKLAKEKKLEELEELVSGAEKSLASSRSEMDRLTQRATERSARIGRNSMESVITAVDQNWGFVVIGAGSNSGFTPQTSLLVRRDGRKIGRVRPSAIEPTQTIAEIEMESLAPGVRLQPGDRVILAKPITN